MVEYSHTRDTICARPNFKAPLTTGRDSGWDQEEDQLFEARFSTQPAKIVPDPKQEDMRSQSEIIPSHNLLP